MSSQHDIMKRHGFSYPHLREDPNTGIHTARIRFPNGSGKKVFIELPPSLLAQKRLLLARLQDADAALPKGQHERDALLKALAAAEPEKRQRYAKSSGWSDDGSYFVIFQDVIGDGPVEQLGIRIPPGSNDEPGKLRHSGTASHWKKTIGKYALASSTATLAVCVALAAPLLKFGGQSSFTICLCSKTRSGKTIASLVAASLVGSNSIEEFLNWNSSTTSVEERLAEYCDMMIVIDDISTMEGTNSAKFRRISRFGYEVSTNQGKGRGRPYKVAAGIAHLRHRAIVLTSAEKSLSDLACSARTERQGGDVVRMIDLPANGEGDEDVFDRLQVDDPATRTEAVEKLTKAIVKAAKRNHGTAFHAYIEKLICMDTQVTAAVETLISDFVGRVVLGLDSSQVRDMAKKFGLLYAGGVLAVRFEIVPWTEGDVLSALTTCFGRARGMVSDDAKLLKDGLELFREYIAALPMCASDGGPTCYEAADGYRQRLKNVETFTIKVDAFNSVLPFVSQRTLVQNWLLENAYLEVREIRGPCNTKRLRPREQFQWPDGQRRRSYRIKGTPRLPSA